MSNVTGGKNPGIVIGGTGQSSVDPGNVTDSGQRLVTHHCPACEAAARERDAAYEDARQMQARLQRLIDAEPQRELADLRARLTRAARLLDAVAENQIFLQPEFEQARAELREEAK